MNKAVTIFDYLKDIIVTKSGNLALDGYAPFLVNRWISFINPRVCEAVNELNSKSILEDKQFHYKLLLCLFPKMKSVPRINYIKKVKENADTNEDQKIKLIAQQFEISQKEALWLLGECPTN